MSIDASNPLLDFSGLPRFDAIRPEHVTPALEQLIADARQVVQQVEAPAARDRTAGVVETRLPCICYGSGHVLSWSAAMLFNEAGTRGLLAAMI